MQPRFALLALLALIGILVLASCGALSPDAGPAAAHQQIVYTDVLAGAGGPSSSELWVMNLDGSDREQLTHNDRQEFLPHFSPDATRLVYTTFDTGSYGQPDAKTDVAIWDFASGSETNLTNTGRDSYPVWSPDGTRLAFLSQDATGAHGLWVMNADGSERRSVIQPKGPPSELTFGDIAWSNNDWLLFVVADNTNNCFKAHLDVIRPDGSDRHAVTDGGPSCTPPGREQSGDADPGFSRDGTRIVSSRGLPRSPAGGPDAVTARRTIAVTNQPWVSGKPETDLSNPDEPDCVEGVPKPAPHDDRILLFRLCFDRPGARGGIYVTDSPGTGRTFVTTGFGPDWNATVN